MNDLEKLLQSVRAEVEQQDAKQSVRLQQDQRAQKQRLVALQEREAQEFLQKLQPGSADARWFERFATHYQTRLEAAIAYTESLREVEL